MKKIRILSLVGSTYPLDRLTKQVDELGKNKEYEIFAQIGESNYEPKNIKWNKYLSYEELQKKIKWVDIIISHAGAGSIIDVLASKKKLLLFPRLKQYGEAVDDHQLEICKKLKSNFGVLYTTNPKEINIIIKNIPITLINETPKLVIELKNLIK